MQTFSGCAEQGPLSSFGVQASHCGGFSGCGTQALALWASAVVACGFSSYSSRALERRLSSCGVLLAYGIVGSSQTSDETWVSRISRQIPYR